MLVIKHVKDQDAALNALSAMLSGRKLRYWEPFYEASQGVVFRCGPAIYDKQAALKSWEELSVSAGLPAMPDVIGGISFWCWEEVWENTWDARLLGETSKSGLLSFALNDLEFGDSFCLSASVAVGNIHQVRDPFADGKIINVEVKGDQYALTDPGETMVELSHRGTDEHCYLRLLTNEFRGHSLPAEWFALSASGDEETKWHEFSDKTGNIKWKMGRPGKNCVIQVSVRDHLLSDPRFVIVEILDSSHQRVAKAFVGLYQDDELKRSDGEIVLSIVAPSSADDDLSQVRDYFYRVLPGRTDKLSADDREPLELSLLATGHSLSRESLERVLDEIR